MKRHLIVAGLAFSFVASGVTGQEISIGERRAVESQVLGEERTIFVSVPAGVGDSAKAPVLYLTDAETQFEHTVTTVRFLARHGLMPPLIVVGVTNTDRTRDLTPTAATLTDASGEPIELPTAGGADRFLDFVADELVPWVESSYPALDYRLFAGHSFGGLLAVHAFVTRPELFDAVIAVSPSLHWDDRLMLRLAREYFQEGRPARPRSLFLSLGDENEAITVGFDEFTDYLSTVRDEQLRWASRIFPDEDHGSVVLRSHERGLRFVFAGWKAPEDPATGWPAGTLADVEAHVAGLSERLGLEVAIPETTLNLLGYRLLGEDRTEAALAAFRRATELYPESANVWDSLGEGLMAAGDTAAARDAFARALALSEGGDDPNRRFYEQHLAEAEAALADQE